MNKNKPLVYIASPYTKGDPIINLRSSLDIFDRCLNDSLVTPIAPLLSVLSHLTHPRDYRDWMNLDFEMINHCDAVLAVDAKFGDYTETESNGRDEEIAYAKSIGIHVFYSYEDLSKWAAVYMEQKFGS